MATFVNFQTSDGSLSVITASEIVPETRSSALERTTIVPETASACGGCSVVAFENEVTINEVAVTDKPTKSVATEIVSCVNLCSYS